MAKIPCAIIGSGNIGTDVMVKVMRTCRAHCPRAWREMAPLWV